MTDRSLRMVVRAHGEGGAGPASEWRWFDVAARHGRGYAALLFGCTQWSMGGGGCSPLPGSVTLGRTARLLSARGMRAVGAVVVDRTHERPRCDGLVRHATWPPLARLRDRHGWSLVSAGLTYTNFAARPPAEQHRLACGSLPVLAGRGHVRAGGLFAYPGDSSDLAAQRDVVSRCFGFGRTYGFGRNHRRSTGPPWFQRTFSLDGGACHDRALACSRIVTPVFPARYQARGGSRGCSAPGRASGASCRCTGSWRAAT